jgi:hypothetical protein
LCGGTQRVIVDITQPDVIEKILGHARQTRASPAKAESFAKASPPIATPTFPNHFGQTQSILCGYFTR